MAKFKLLRGTHGQGKVEQPGHPRYGKTRIYEKGDIIESESDLCRLNGPPPCSPKYARIGEGGIEDTVASLNAQEREELRKLREEKRQAEHRQRKQELADEEPDKGFGDGPTEEPDDELSDYTVERLREVAEEEEIELVGASRKAEILGVIRDARKARQTS